MAADRFHVDMPSLCRFIEMLDSSMDDYLYAYDYANDYYFISPHAVDRFSIPGYSFHDIVRGHKLFVHPDDLPKLEEELRDLAQTDRCTHNMLYRWLSKNNEPVWINCRGHVFRDDNKKALYLVGCINEIGLRQKADNISGLLGTSSFQSFLANYVSVVPDGYFLRLGIDDLKIINARLGLEYGDMLLRETASCLSKLILPGQKLYRVLGDEYLVLDFLGGSVEDGKEIYNHTRQLIESYIASMDYEAVFTISGGLVKCSDIQDFSYSSIMKLTEFTLDRAKAQGKNRCYVFRQEDYDKFVEKRHLMLQLRQSVSNGCRGFEVYFQPIVNAADSHNHVIGAEALLRFHSHGKGMVPPDVFIPMLEESGLIIPVGRWVLDQALGACKRFQAYIPGFRINVNLSPVQIMKSHIAQEILAAIEEHGLAPSQVVIELTESQLLESDSRFSDTWRRLKDRGILLALDDFGSGYSNFRYLTDLSPDYVKIDRIFTMKAMKNSFEFKLVSLFSEIAHALDLRICIEGIETKEESERIRQVDPDSIQGYYFGRPCPFDQFMELLAEKKPDT